MSAFELLNGGHLPTFIMLLILVPIDDGAFIHQRSSCPGTYGMVQQLLLFVPNVPGTFTKFQHGSENLPSCLHEVETAARFTIRALVAT